MSFNAFENRILKYMRENRMTMPGDLVLCGLSGGADSVCLVAVLKKLERILGIRLMAMHVHHGLRGEEADRDLRFSRELAESLGVPFREAYVDVTGLAREQGLTEEEAARILRYEALEDGLREAMAEAEEQAAAGQAAGRGDSKVSADNAAGADAQREAAGNVHGNTGSPRGHIAVAHHADDQAETILLNLFRGSGLKGMGGMRPVRGSIIRPLLMEERGEILDYLHDRGLSFETDSTNLENDHTRNYLRNEILPALKAGVNIRAAEHIVSTGAMIGEADRYLESEAAAFLDEHGEMEEVCDSLNSRPLRSIRLGQTKLKEKPQILRRYVIIEALRRLDVPLKDWGEVHFADIDRALNGAAGYHVDLPGSVFAENIRHETILYRKE